MFENYYCFRCEKGFKWEHMTATPTGTLFCPECWQTVNPENEPKRNCPVDGTVMKKLLMAEKFTIDVCPSCRGTWFDEAELDFLRQTIRDKDRDLALTAALLSVF